MRSRILEGVQRSAIGLVSDGDLGDGILERGTMSARFHSDGKVPDSSEKLKSEVKYGERQGADSLSISAEIPSIPILEEVMEARAWLTCSREMGTKSKVGA